MGLHNLSPSNYPLLKTVLPLQLGQSRPDLCPRLAVTNVRLSTAACGTFWRAGRGVRDINSGEVIGACMLLARHPVELNVVGEQPPRLFGPPLLGVMGSRLPGLRLVLREAFVVHKDLDL